MSSDRSDRTQGYLPSRAEMADAEAYLRRLDVPADDWIVKSGVQFYRVAEVAGRVFDQDATGVRAAADRGDIPHSALLPGGWRFDRGGLLWWIARLRGFRTQSAQDSQDTQDTQDTQQSAG